MLKNKIFQFGKKIKNSLPQFKKTVTIQMYAGTGISSPYPYGGNTYGNGAKFTAGMSGYAPIIHHDHFTLRQRARDAMYDSTVAKGMVERKADTVVDTGLKLKPTPDASVLGRDPGDLELWAEDVANRFHMWAKSKKSHTARTSNFYQNQRLYSIFQERDNDIFVRFNYTKDKDQLNPLSIDFLEPNQIRGHSYTSTYTQGVFDDGIIRDANNREIGYKIWYYDKETGGYKEKTIPARGEKSGRQFMVHGFYPEYAGQGRGFTKLAHVLQEFELLTTFKLSTIKKAISQSQLAMAVENKEHDPSNPLEGRVAGPMKEYGTLSQYESNSSVSNNDELEPRINYTSLKEATFDEPGSVGVFSMKAGDELKYLKDTSPSTSFDTFLNSFCSYVMASESMPLEVFLMKFNNNYSASRASLILFWRVAQIWRDEMAADFLEPVYEAWLSEEIAAGRIQAPGWTDSRMRAAWLMCEWSGAPMPNIDPVKQMQAAKMAIEMCLETFDDAAREHNGSSGKANRIKNQRQNQEVPEPAWGWGNKQSNKKDNKDEEE